MNIKISATTLNSYEYLKNLFNKQSYINESYKDKKIEEFVLKILGYESVETPYTKRGKEFEKLVDMGQIDVIEENFGFSKAQKQVYVEKKYIEYENQGINFNVYMVGFIDYLKDGEIYDLKRKNEIKSGEFDLKNNMQTAFYTDALNKNKIVYVCGYSKSLEPVPSLINYMVHEIKTEQLEKNREIIRKKIKEFLNFIQEMGLFNYYVKFNKLESFKKQNGKVEML